MSRPVLASMAAPDTVVCRFCGAVNPAEDAYCDQCHKLLGERPDDLGLDGPPKPRPSSNPAGVPPRSYNAQVGKGGMVGLRCLGCGAPIKPVKGESILTCEYCGASLILPAPAPTSTPPNPYFRWSGDDWLDAEPDDAIGLWGYRAQQWGPGWRVAGGVSFIIFGLIVAIGFGTTTNCDPVAGGQCVTTSVTGAEAFGGIAILLGVLIMIYGLYGVYGESDH